MQIELKPHILLLGLINESPMGMGRQLLASCVIGEESEKIKKLNLNKLAHFSCLPLYEKKDVFELIDSLISKKYIEFQPLPNSKFIKIIVLTPKGIGELENPADNVKLDKSFAGHYKKIESVTDQDKQLFLSFGNLLDNLSDEQKKAVIEQNREILCIAGAGSGKTRVLTKRIWFLSNYRSVPQNKILAITFTRKARQEMINRLEKLILNNEIQIETFNSFCEKILKKYENIIYGKPFQVMDYKFKVRLIMDSLNKLNVKIDSVLDNYYTNKKLYSNDKKTLFFGFINDVFSVLDYQRNNYLDNEELMSLILSHDNAFIRNLVSDIIIRVNKTKSENGLRDYTDQIVHAINFFKSNKDLVPKFDHILIDEYQDINSLQFELIQLLKPNNLFAVGDPRQSIYGWRGSKIDFILDFQDYFPKSKILQLNTNYRSSRDIVNMCNKVINELKLPNLDSHNGGEDSINILKHKDENTENLFVTHSILNMDCRKKEIFVLARTNKQIEKISKEFDKVGMKYVKRTIEDQKLRRLPKEDEVTLSTIHAIKGMEAEVVYLLGAGQKNHPCKASEHPLLEVVKINDSYDKYAEELRLFYVALSRAKKKLIINYTGTLAQYISEETPPVKTKMNTTLSNELRDWRYSKSQELNVPPYIIFNDKTLHEICENLPTSFEDLYEITGFGPFKVRKYGNDIVKIVLNHC